MVENLLSWLSMTIDTPSASAVSRLDMGAEVNIAAVLSKIVSRDIPTGRASASLTSVERKPARGGVLDDAVKCVTSLGSAGFAGTESWIRFTSSSCKKRRPRIEEKEGGDNANMFITIMKQ